MSECVDLILYGHPPISEVRARAVFDLRRLKTKLKGDVDLDVTVTIPNPRCMVPAMKVHAAVEQVILAALYTETIESKRSIRSVRYTRPVVAGLDTTTYSFRPSADRLLLI